MRKPRRVVAIDMPGHGDSTFPAGLPNGARFGDLLIEDNVSVVLQSIDALRRKGLGASVLMGHSMGGLEVQASQESLLAQGSSLRARGISSVILLAPVPAHGRPWSPLASDPSAFIVTDATLGTYLQLTPEAFVPQAFLTKAGVVAANAPTPAEWAVAFHSTMALKEGVPAPVVQAIREHRLPDDAKLSALSTLTRALIEKRGHLDEKDMTAFTGAGFAPEQVLEVIAGLAVSTMANYAGNITRPPLEEPFKAQAWNG